MGNTRLIIKPKRDAAIAALVVFLVTVLCNLTVTLLARQHILHGIQEGLLAQARTAAVFTNGDLHQTLTNPEQKGGEDYNAAQAPYRKILKANKDLRYVYTSIMRDGKIYFIIDTKQKNSDRPDNEEERNSTAQIMEEYPDATEHFREALEKQISVVESQPYSDEWGTFISAYAPFYNSDGEFIGIVGVDLDVQDFNYRMMWVWLAFGVGTVLSLLLSLVVHVVVRNIRTGHASEQALRIERTRMVEAFQQQVAEVTATLADVSKNASAMAEKITEVTQKSADATEIARSSIRGASGKIGAISLVCDQLVGTSDALCGAAQTSHRMSEEVAKFLENSSTASKQLEAASQNIAKVVGVITAITEDIDLLALNAAIEAARAGDAGKGFSVVASEVKALSQQVAGAVVTIRDYVSQIQQATKSTLSLFGGLEAQLGSMGQVTQTANTTIGAQRELIQLIATDASEVSNSAQLLEKNMISINEVAQITETQMQHIHELVKTLAEQNVFLNQEVSQFLRSLDEAAEKKRVA